MSAGLLLVCLIVPSLALCVFAFACSVAGDPDDGWEDDPKW